MQKKGEQVQANEAFRSNEESLFNNAGPHLPEMNEEVFSGHQAGIEKARPTREQMDILFRECRNMFPRLSQAERQRSIKLIAHRLIITESSFALITKLGNHDPLLEGLTGRLEVTIARHEVDTGAFERVWLDYASPRYICSREGGIGPRGVTTIADILLSCRRRRDYEYTWAIVLIWLLKRLSNASDGVVSADRCEPHFDNKSGRVEL